MLYFALFAFEGDRGFSSYRAASQQVAAAQQQLTEVQHQRETLERRVIALRPQSLDPDLLDDQARRELGYVRPGEVVIFSR